MEKTNILEAFRFRHACKRFDPDKKIAKDDIDFILAAMEASSDYIQSMMLHIQQLPPEIAANKGRLYHKFLESDFELAGNERALFEWACRQVYIALGNMMTSAALIGIDSCPIEGFDKAQAEKILREEGILKDASFGLACIAAFGYRQSDPRAKTRRPAHEVIEWVE